MAFKPHSNETKASHGHQSQPAARTQNLPGDFENWQQLSKHVDDPATARLIVSFLDKAPPLKLTHAGLYLRAANVVETVQREHAQQVAKQLEIEAAHRAAKIQRIQKIGSSALYFAYRCLRLVGRAGRQLFELATASHQVRA